MNMTLKELLSLRALFESLAKQGHLQDSQDYLLCKTGFGQANPEQ